MTHPMDAGPIVFLNPLVILDQLGPTPVGGGTAMFGLRSGGAEPRVGAELVGQLCREVGAVLVLTDLARMGDVRARLSRIGLRAAYHPDWMTSPDAPGTATGIAIWLEDHGSPPHVVIDRPGGGPGSSAQLAVPAGSDVSAAGIEALIATLR